MVVGKQPSALADLTGASVPSATLPRQVCQHGMQCREQSLAVSTPLSSRNDWQGATHSTVNDQGLIQAKSHSLSNVMPSVV